MLLLNHKTVREKSLLGQKLCAVCRKTDLQVMVKKSNAEAMLEGAKGRFQVFTLTLTDKYR